MVQKGILEYWGKLIFWFIIVLYPIKGWSYIVPKQWIWEDYAGTMVSAENEISVSTKLLIVWGDIFW